MTYAVWTKDRPMVPTYDYPLPAEAVAGRETKSGYPWDSEHHVATPAGMRQYHLPIGAPIKAKPKVSPEHLAALGSIHNAPDGLDTPSSAFGMTYRRDVAHHPLITDAKQLDWSKVPTTTYAPPRGLVATEERLKSGPIRKVIDGAPFRRGYDPQILRTDGGDIVIDGHHRVAMHAALGDDAYGAKVLDLRGGLSLQQGLAKIEADRKAAEVAREAKLHTDAQAIAERLVQRATASEPQVTPLIEGTVTDHGGYMEGLDNRLKTLESTARKIVTKAHRKHTDAQGGAAGISDVLRYTAVIPTADYTDGVKATLRALGAAGFHPTVTNNYWPKGDAYSGLNILLNGKGQDFEIQFHTPESFAAKDANHDDYDIARDTERPLEDRMAAWSRMVPKWDDVPQPPGWLDFGGLFIYDAPGQGTGRGRYVNRYEAQGLPTPPSAHHQTQWDEGEPVGDLFDEGELKHHAWSWAKKLWGGR